MERIKITSSYTTITVYIYSIFIYFFLINICWYYENWKFSVLLNSVYMCLWMYFHKYKITYLQWLFHRRKSAKFAFKWKPLWDSVLTKNKTYLQLFWDSQMNEILWNVQPKTIVYKTHFPIPVIFNLKKTYAQWSYLSGVSMNANKEYQIKCMRTKFLKRQFHKVHRFYLIFTLISTRV